jgi:hypothetical protein
MWVEEETKAPKCEVVRECNKINTTATCNQLNATNTTGGCFWLYDNNDEINSNGEGECIIKVFFFYIIK